MSKRFLLVGLLSLIAVPAAAQDQKSATAFLAEIYTHYKDGAEPPDPATVYDPVLQKLIADDATALDGDVGVLDGDPICDCQDYDIRAVKLTVHMRGPGRADATAAFKNLGRAVTVRFDLVAVDGAWRIADIRNSGMGSLKQALQDEIAGARKP